MRIKDLNMVQSVIDSTPYKNVLLQHLRGEITELDFQFELACGVLDHLDMLKFVALPHPPAYFAEYLQKYANTTNPIAKRKVQERVCSLDQVQKYMGDHMELVVINTSNAEWLEQCIVVAMAKGDMGLADKLHRAYLTYPSELKWLDGRVNWFKKSGNWWQKKVEIKRRQDEDERAKSVRHQPGEPSGTREAGQNEQPAVRQNKGTRGGRALSVV